MTKPGSSSTSVLISVFLLYLVLLAVAIMFSQQLLATIGEKTHSLSGVAIFLAILFPLSLFGALIAQVLKVLKNIRAGLAGNRFKVRLIIFLNAMTLLSTLPQAILFYFFLSGLIQTELIRSTEQALQAGVELSIETYETRAHSLRSILNNPLLGVLAGDRSSKAEWWSNLQALHEPPDALEFLDASNRSIMFFGNETLKIDPAVAASLSPGTGMRESNTLGTVIREKESLLFPAEGRLDVVVSSKLPGVLEQRSDLLVQSRAWFAALSDFKGNITPIIILMFFMFMLPLILISMIAGFFLADEVIRPLINLESAIARISKGDFGVRMTVRPNDEVGFLVASFNRMVSELVRSRDTLKQSERLQTWQDIAQRMAHEIKNPLTPIKLGAQRIQRRYEENSPELDKVIRESVSSIVREVDSISDMLGEFRNFARLPLPVKTAVDMAALVRETWTMYESTCAVQLHADALEGEILMNIDAEQFRQVFKNLFQNAIDAMEGKGEILIRSDRIEKNGDHFARIQVSDTGPGIPAALAATIFQPYVTSKKQGNGLGLAIVEKIIIDHGGEIRCESMAGKGASFIMEIPC